MWMLIYWKREKTKLISYRTCCNWGNIELKNWIFFFHFIRLTSHLKCVFIRSRHSLRYCVGTKIINNWFSKRCNTSHHRNDTFYNKHKTKTKQRAWLVATWSFQLYHNNINMWIQWVSARKTYHKISNIRCAESQNLDDYCLALQLSLPNPSKSGVKWRMKM